MCIGVNHNHVVRISGLIVIIYIIRIAYWHVCGLSTKRCAVARITPIEFMIFVGLLALYLFFTERSRTAVSTGSYRWLDIQGTGAQLPSVDKTIEILNGVLSERKKSAV